MSKFGHERIESKKQAVAHAGGRKVSRMRLSKVAMPDVTACGGGREAVGLTHEEYFADRAARANLPKALDILKRAGVGDPPMKGDKPCRAKKRA
jgi:hypothetical protein